MITTFAPEDLKIFGPEGLQFPDANALTCAQLGITVTKLLEVQPNVRFTQEDLVGYHFVQYGMDSDITTEAIDAAQGGMWRDWDKAQVLRSALPVVLADESTGALAQRIRLGRPQDIEHLRLDAVMSDFFETVTETDHAQSDVISLYPRDGVELEYQGRVSLHIGHVVIDRVLEDLTTYSDVLRLTTEETPVNRTVVASSSSNLTNTSSFPTIQSLRLM